jgi:hypothetical protein
MTDDEKIGVVDATLDGLNSYTVFYENYNICLKAAAYYYDGSSRMIFYIDCGGNREIVAGFPGNVGIVKTKYLISSNK